MGDEGNSKSKKKPTNYKRLGCNFILGLIGFVCLVLAFNAFAPNFLHELPEYFLPASCHEILITDIMDNPPAKMRVIKDLYSRTQVIAVGDEGKDICFFEYSRFVISANERYIALDFSQYLAETGFIEHLFIINALDGSYILFVPENPSNLSKINGQSVRVKG